MPRAPLLYGQGGGVGGGGRGLWLGAVLHSWAAITTWSGDATILLF